MKIRRTLYLSIIVLLFIFTISIIFSILIIAKKEDKEWRKILLKEKILLLEKEIMPFLLEGRLEKMPSKHFQRFSFPFAVKTKKSFLLFKKEQKIKLSKKNGEPPPLKNHKIYRKEIKTPFSDYNWGTLYIYQIKEPFFTMSLKPYRLLIFFIFFSLFLYIALISIKEFNTFDIKKNRSFGFLPSSKKVVKEFERLEKEKNTLEEEINKIKEDRDKELIPINEAILNIREKTKALTKIKKNLFEARKRASSHNIILGIAHEINNPLTTIVGYLQLLSMSKTLSKETREKLLGNVEKIFNTKEKLEKLISLSPEKVRDKVNLLEILMSLKNSFPSLKINTNKRIYFTGNKEKLKEVFLQFLNTIEKYSPKTTKIEFFKKKNKNQIKIFTVLEKEIKNEISLKKELIDFIIFFEINGTIKLSISPHHIRISIYFSD